jgi:large subunit ribosomal protein L15
LIKRLPRKRGFTSIFRTEYSIVSVEKLNVFPPGTEVTPEALLQAGLVKSLKKPIKILGGGEVCHTLLVKADRFSASAQDKIVAAGGKVEKARDAT